MNDMEKLYNRIMGNETGEVKTFGDAFKEVEQKRDNGLDISLPFDWCPKCEAIDIRTSRAYTDMGHIITHTCEHADDCLAMYKAMADMRGEE